MPLQPATSNCGMAVCEWDGQRSRNELQFRVGALITNISQKCAEWCVGDYRGDKQKFFKANCVRLLTRDEVAYISNLRSNRVGSNSSTCHSVLNLQKDYQVSFNLDDRQSATIVIEAVQSNPVIGTFRHYKLACPTTEDLEQQYQLSLIHI